MQQLMQYNVKIITTMQEAPKIVTILNHAIPSLKLEIAQRAWNFL